MIPLKDRLVGAIDRPDEALNIPKIARRPSPFVGHHVPDSLHHGDDVGIFASRHWIPVEGLTTNQRLRRLLHNLHSRNALVCTFLALLELVRLQAVLLRQDRVFSDIIIKKHENFDQIMTEQLALRDDWK